MGKLKNVGIGIGIALVSVIGVSVVIMAFQADTYSDARFASLQAFYDEFDDKTTVVMLLTNNDGNYVKANGNVKITLCNEIAFTDQLTNCFSNSFSFKKDSFYTWQDNFGRKFTGHQFVINGELSAGWWWDVSADITLDDGKQWVDVDARFYALED